MGTAERAFCECDLQFVSSGAVPIGSNQHYDPTKCIPFDSTGTGECCESSNGHFQFYNKISNDCCDGAVVPTGTC